MGQDADVKRSKQIRTRAGTSSSDSLKTSSVKSATRVLDLFEFLGRWDSVRTHAEIAEELEIPKSSLTQLLKTLVSREYLSCDPATKSYKLGPAIAFLAQRSHRSNELLEVAKLQLESVSRETGESCAINLLRGLDSEVSTCIMSDKQRLVYHMRKGDTAPLHATSGGKALLAHMSEEMLEDFFSRAPMNSVTPNTITSEAVLRTQLKDIRMSGYAYVDQEFTPGICGIASAILDTSGYPIASINVAIPVGRYSEELKRTCETSLRRAVRAITHQIQS